jgi:RimJ/RimL family protein N-acetyltransferase
LERTEDAIKLSGALVELESFSERFITDTYLGWLRDTEINRYLVEPNQDTTLADVRDYCHRLISSERDYFFAILDRVTGRHIGNLRLGPIDAAARHCQLGMLIGDRDYHGRGFGTEAVNLATSFCFEVLRMHKVHLNVVDENRAAVRIYEKNGFVTEGLLKDHIFLGGRFYDLRLMGLMEPSER